MPRVFAAVDGVSERRIGSKFGDPVLLCPFDPIVAHLIGEQFALFGPYFERKSSRTVTNQQNMRQLRHHRISDGDRVKKALETADSPAPAGSPIHHTSIEFDNP